MNNRIWEKFLQKVNSTAPKPLEDPSLKESIGFYHMHINWKIKSGDSLSFWHSLWHEHSPLSQHNPRLYALTTKKRNSIKVMWSAENSEWDLYPRRPLRSVESTFWDEMKISLHPRLISDRTFLCGNWISMVASRLLPLNVLFMTGTT